MNSFKTPGRRSPGWLSVALAGTVLISAEAGAVIDVAQSPLLVTTTIKSNLIVALDDSGSMSFETLTPTNDGALYWQDGVRSFIDANGQPFFGTGGRKSSYVFPYTEGPRGSINHRVIPPLIQYAFMRSAEYNRAYYDPSETYTPWPSFGSRTFLDMDPTAAVSDPSGSTGNSTRTFNLTATIRTTGNTGTFELHNGMVIAKGQEYHDGTTWVTPAVDTAFTGGNDRTRGVTYYPATYYRVIDAGSYSVSDGTIAVIGSCANPDPAHYKFFETRPGSLSSVTAGLAALAPDGRCLVEVRISAGTPEMQNFANWFSYFRKRHLAVRNGVVASFRDLELGMHVGMFTINNRNTVTMREFDGNPTIDERNLFLEDVVAENFGGGTPNRQALDHAGSQFERTTNPIVEFECQKNFGVLFTDGFSSLGGIPTPGNVDGDNGPPYADSISNSIADIAMNYYEALDVSGISFPPEKQGNVPIPPACAGTPTPNPLDCNADPHMNTYVVTLNGLGTIFGVTHDDVNDAYGNPPLWPDVNSDRDPTQIDDLYHAAVNGRGRMLNAATPTDVADQFLAALADIVARSQPRTALKATTSRIDTSSRLYQAGFDSEDWAGELLAVDLDGSQVWSAAAELDANNSRRIYTFTSTGGEDLAFASLDSQVQADLLTELRSRFARADLDAAFGNSDSAQGQAVIDYITGVRSAEVQNGGLFRNRSTVLGDIINSEPLLAGSGNEGWGRLPDPAGDAYEAYLGTMESPGPKTSRATMLYVGANDGLLHAFDAATGAERFAYAPQTVAPGFAELVDPTYTHRFFVDATPRVADAYNGSWKTVLVGGIGAGGRAMFAIDVTNPGSVIADDVLWEFTSADDADLGLTLGQPVITRIADGRWVAIFGNGYNSVNEDGVLFVVDLFNGNLIRKLSTGVGSAAAPAGLGPPRVEMDPDTGLFAAAAYAGDLQGNLWKFDISSSNTAQWDSAFRQAGNARPLFIARSPNGNQPQPITAAPNIARHPKGGLLIYFGTGRYFANGDNLVGPGTRIDTFYAVLDEGSTSQIDRGDLVNVDIIAEAQLNGRNVRRLAEETVNLSDVRGFFIDLEVGNSNMGERVLRPPQIRFGRLVFTTFEPSQTACISGGITRLYFLSALTGSGALPIDPCQDCGSIELDIGAPAAPPIVIDTTKEQEIAFCVANPGDPACEKFDPDNPNYDPKQTGGVICRFGQRPVSIIDPTTLERTQVGCIDDGRVGWGQDHEE